MTALWTREDFEGAAAGTNIGTGNTSFNAVSIAGGTMQFSAAQAVTGTRSMVVSGTQATQARWGSFTAKSHLFISFYLYIATWGTSATVIIAAKNASNTNRAQLRLTNNSGTPRLGMRNGTSEVTAGANIATGQWHRVDWELDYANSVQRMWRYSGATLHSTNTADADYASGNQTFNTGTVERVVVGHDGAVANANTIYWDQPAGDDATMPPPAVSTTVVAVTAATETDAAQPLTRRKTRAVGTATEADTSQALTRTKRRTLGTANESDTAQPLARRHARALGATAETDQAQPLARRATKAIGTATSTETAQPLARVKRRTLGVATETDTALAITRHEADITTVPVETATETDTAVTVRRVKRRVLGTAVETSTAVGISRRKTRPVGPAVEGDQAVTLGRAHRRSIDPAVETSTATSLARIHRRDLGTATETCTAGPLGRIKRTAIGTADELDEALPVSAHAYIPRDITLTGTLAPRRVTGTLDTRHGGTLTTAVRDAALTTTRRGGLAPAHRRTGRIEHT